MAKRRIEGSDVFAPDFTAQAVRDVLKLESALNSLKDNIKDVIVITKTMASASGTNTTAGISNITGSYTAAGTAISQFNKIKAEEQRLTEQLNALLNGQSERVISLRKEIQQTTAAIRAKQQVDNEQIGVYQKSVNHLNQMSRALKDLYMAGKQNEQATIAMKKEYEALHLSVAKAEQEVGQFQRQVGNYGLKSQRLFNYELFQFQQILRELPNFAISTRIGIMALSNNLPQAADAFKQMSSSINEATGKAYGFRGAAKMVLSSVFSWQTGLLVLITLSIAFADKIGELVTGTEKLSKAEQERVDAMESLNKEVEKLNKGYIDEKVNVEALLRVAQDENRSKVDREKAIKRLNEISPEYLGNLTLENVSTEEGIGLQERYIKLLQARASATAMMKRMVAEEEKKYDVEKAISGIGVGYFDEASAKTALGDAEYERLSGVASDRATRYGAAFSNEMADVLRSALLGRLVEIDKELTRLQSNFDPLLLISESKTPGSSGKGASGGKGAKYSSKFDPLGYRDWKEKDNTQGALLDSLEFEKYMNETLRKINANNLLEHETNAEKRKEIEENLSKDLIAIDIAYLKKKLRILGPTTSTEAAKIQAEIRLRESELYTGDKAKKGEEPLDIAKKKQKQLQETMQATLTLARAIDDLLSKDEQRRQAQLNRQIDATKRRQDEYRQLAALGSKQAKDNIAFEERKQAELERKQAQLERRQQKRQLAISALNAYSQRISRGDDNATANTISDISTLLSFVGALSFYDGTESVGKDDALIDRKTAKDPYLAWVHPNERIMTAQQNAMVGNLSNDELANLAYTYRFTRSVPMGMPYNDDVVQKLDSIEKVLKNQEPPQMMWNDIDRAMEYKFAQGNRIIKQKHKTNGVFRTN